MTTLPTDLVRLGNVSLFMPTNDNLYDLVVPEGCKRFALDAHRAFAGVRWDRDAGDVTALMFTYLRKLDGPVHLLDLGAWVGDVAIRLARFAKDWNIPFRADCYDPSLAATLIPPNIEINGVADRINYHLLGISLDGGPHVFTELSGHSDSSHLVGTGGNAGEDRLIQTVPLSAVIPDTDAHLMVKIDLEGIDADVVMQNHAALTDATLIVEFAPHQPQYTKYSPAGFIRALQETHTLFDIYYLPRPCMAARVGLAEAFAAEISGRPYGYTDVLCVPRSLVAHDALVTWLAALAPIEPAYRMG